MSLLDRIFKRSLPKTVVVEDRNAFIKSRINQVNNISIGNRAELNSTVYTCINLLQSMISKCDLEIYSTVDGRKTKAIDHSYYNTIRFNPDLKLSTKKWLSYALTSMYFEGNFFAYIDPYTKQFKPLPELQKVGIADNQIGYAFKGIQYENGNQRWLPQSSLIHFYLMSKDGMVGLNPIESIRSEIEIQKGGEAGVRNYYQNGLNNQLYLEVDVETGLMSSDPIKAKEFIDEVLVKGHGGIWKNDSIPAIPPLYKLKALPQPQLDYLENNKYSISQIGSLFGIPEPFLGIQGSSSTYGKAAEQVALFNSTLSNITAMIEDELSSKLLTIDERKAGLSIEFDLKKLFASDPLEKAQYLSTLNSLGAVNANEIRQEFNLPYVDGAGMNTYFRQMQYVDINATSGSTPSNINFIQPVKG